MNITSEELAAALPPALYAKVQAELGIVAKPKRRSKYGNKPVVVDGFWFASQAEARRYEALVLLQAAGEVLWFCLQPTFMLAGGVQYRADFIVLWAGYDPWVTVEDIKGGNATKTKAYRIKKRLMLDKYGIEIVEVQA